MSYQFKRGGLIVVTCRVAAEGASAVCSFGLDTGAARTMVSADRVAMLGLSTRPGIKVVTASRVEDASLATVPEINALGLTRRGLQVVVLPLPASSGLDGLLGLDFFRDTRLTIDFRTQTVTVA